LKGGLREREKIQMADDGKEKGRRKKEKGRNNMTDE
jgi:hypothetical protein